MRTSETAAALLFALLATATCKGQCCEFRFTETFGSDAPPGSALVIYDPTDGNYTLKANDVRIDTWQHDSTSGLFNCDKANDVFTGLFDLCTANRIYKYARVSFYELDFGNILPPGMTFDEINSEGEVAGLIGAIGHLKAWDPDSPYLYVVPEPSGVLLLSLGALATSWSAA